MCSLRLRRTGPCPESCGPSLVHASITTMISFFLVDRVYTVCPTGRWGFHLIVDFERLRKIGANHASLWRCLCGLRRPYFARRHCLGQRHHRCGFRNWTKHISDSAEFARCGKVRSLETSLLEFQMKRLLSLVGVVLFLAAGQASANIVYTFSGVTFDDGGTLTGTFTTNDTFDTLVDFDITTSPGAGGLGFTYTPLTAGSSSTSLPTILVLSTAALDEILQVTFAGGLTATGAPILIGTFDSFEQAVPTARRDIVAGSAIVAPVTVPEPSTLALLATTGVLGVLTSLRRRRQA